MQYYGHSLKKVFKVALFTFQWLKLILLFSLYNNGTVIFNLKDKVLVKNLCGDSIVTWWNNDGMLIKF